MTNEEYDSESHSDGSEEIELDSDEEVSQKGFEFMKLLKSEKSSICSTSLFHFWAKFKLRFSNGLRFLGKIYLYLFSFLNYSFKKHSRLDC